MNQKLFHALDEAFRKHGAKTQLANPGFYPHYEEVKGADNVRPTWYTQYEVEEKMTLITMYDTIDDVCMSTLFGPGKRPVTVRHTGYPKNRLEAIYLVNKLFNE